MSNERNNIIILNNKIITDKSSGHRVYPTTRQKRLLVDILEKNPGMILCHFNSDFTFEDSNKLWEDAAKTLNAVGAAKKTAKGWKKCWHDLKRNTRLKVARNHSFQESGKIDQMQLKIMRLDSAKHKNNDDLLLANVEVIENVKQEETSPIPEENRQNYFLSVSNDLTDSNEVGITDYQPNYTTTTDKSVNTDEGYCYSLEERKLQLKKEYYDSKLRILEKQTQIQDRMLQVMKGIATSLIDKL